MPYVFANKVCHRIWLFFRDQANNAWFTSLRDYKYHLMLLIKWLVKYILAINWDFRAVNARWLGVKNNEILFFIFIHIWTVFQTDHKGTKTKIILYHLWTKRIAYLWKSNGQGISPQPARYLLHYRNITSWGHD